MLSVLGTSNEPLATERRRALLCLSAPPHLGDDETIEAVRGTVITMNCNPKEDGLRPTITWTKV